MAMRTPDDFRLPYDAPYRGRDNHPYRPTKALIHAANVALDLDLPLLLTGEPGSGKTDFAFAVHRYQHDPAAEHDPETLPQLHECYIRSDTQARDLLYRYDALRRFGDSQHGDEQRKRQAMSARPYIRVQPLGAALMRPERRVVLIDEIDKAPRDLPNDLLRELDQGVFEIPEIDDLDDGDDKDKPTEDHPLRLSATVRRPRKWPRPFVIITSNRERQLPKAFLRRCMYFHIESHSDAQLKAILRTRIDQRPDWLDLDTLVTVYQGLRGVRNLSKPPSTAELSDWATALCTRPPSKLIATIERFVRALASMAAAEEAPRWDELPALGCLLKMYEDIELARRTPVSASAKTATT